MMESHLWSLLPVEVRLLILEHMTPSELFIFQQVSSACAALVQDESLCRTMLERHYPLAASRMRVEIAERGSNVGPYERLRAATILRHRLYHRQPAEAHEIVTQVLSEYEVDEDDDDDPNDEDLFTAMCSFGRLVYCFGMTTLRFMNLETLEMTSITLPEHHEWLQYHVEETSTFVLPGMPNDKREVHQYDQQGKHLETFVVELRGINAITANNSFFALYGNDHEKSHSLCALVRHSPQEHEDYGKVITILKSRHHSRYSMDDQYLYEIPLFGTNILIRRLDDPEGMIMTYHMEHSEVVFSCVNRHCYLTSNTDVRHLCGQTTVSAATDWNALGETDEERSSTVIKSVPVFDVAGVIAWECFSNGLKAGAFTYLPAELPSTQWLDCGRINLPKWFFSGLKFEDCCTLFTDHRFTVCALYRRLIVMQWI